MLPRERIDQPADVAATSPMTARFSISNARLFYKQREFAESVLNYIAVLKSLSPETRSKFLPEFSDTLRAYLQHEVNEGNARDVLKISSSIFGATEYSFLRLQAEYYYKNGKLLKSLEIFEKAIGVAKNDLEWLNASTSVENIRSHLFDAWHWRMINDVKRNNKFASAICAALKLKPNARVLDIGCGSGIFSVVAARNGNPTVACDQNEVMAKIANNCFAQNNVHIDLFETHSNKLQLNTRCNLLVTETVDCAIFGERIVETILDAKERLLDVDSILIPNKASLCFSMVEADFIRRENIFEYSNSLTIISNCCNVPELDGKRVISPSPYTCAYLAELPDGYRQLSPPIQGFTVDFTNVQQLKQIKNNKFITEIVLRATENGTVSAVCVWFRLNLFQEHEIFTAPDEGYCWQQTIFPIYPLLNFAAGQTLRLHVFVKNGALRIRLIDLPETKLEIVRASPWMDLLAMNDVAIRQFYKNATAAFANSQVLDCTELLVSEQFPVASDHSAIRYVRVDAVNISKAICKADGCILYWPFSNQGCLMDNYFTSIFELQARSPQGTTLLPSRISLRGFLITSEQLCRQSRLVPDQTAREQIYCGVDLSPMNEFKVSHFHEIDTRILEYKQISEEVELFHMQFGKDAHDNLKQMTKVKKECIFTCTEQQEAICHAILFWFSIEDPAGNQLDLHRQTSAHLPSAFILPKAKGMKAGNSIQAQFSLLHGDLLIHSVKDFLFL